MTASMKRRNEKRKKSMGSSLAYSPSKSDFDDGSSANNNNHFRNTMNIGGSRNSMTPRRTSRSSSVLDGGNALFNKTFTPKQFKTFKFSASLKNFIDE